MEIDLNEVLRRMKIADVRLTTSLEHLAKHNYHKLTSGLSSEKMPERFWWRHWKSGRGRQR